MIFSLNNVLPEFRARIKPVPLVNILQADSKLDPRIQVADILAGVGRTVATSFIGESQTDSELLSLIRPFINADSIWGDDESWLMLTGERLPS